MKLLFSRILPAIVLCLCGLTGCFETTNLVKLNKDGSGSIQVRMSMSPKLAAMVTGGEEAGAEGDKIYEEEKVKAEAANFGEGVTFVSGKEITRENGWKGYVARYDFADINKVSFNFEQKEGEDGNMGGGGFMEDIKSISFKYTAGDVNSLKVIVAKKTAEELAADKGDATEADGAEEMTDEKLAETKEQMRSMFEGMRVSYFLSVDGEITEATTAFRDTEDPKMIALIDIDLDSLIADDKSFTALAKAGSGADMATMKLTGIRVQREDATISFK